MVRARRQKVRIGVRTVVSVYRGDDLIPPLRNRVAVSSR